MTPWPVFDTRKHNPSVDRHLGRSLTRSSPGLIRSQLSSWALRATVTAASLKLNQNRLRRPQVYPRTQGHHLAHNCPGRPRVSRRFEALPRKRDVRRVVRVLDHEPPRPCIARPTPEVDVHRRACASARREPRVEVHEDGAHESPALERGVPRHVRVVHRELDDLRGAGGADEGVDEDPSVVRGLDVRRLGRVQCGAVDDGAVQADGLELFAGRSAGSAGQVYSLNEGGGRTKLYLNPMPSWKNACLMPSVAAWSV